MVAGFVTDWLRCCQTITPGWAQPCPPLLYLGSFISTLTKAHSAAQPWLSGAVAVMGSGRDSATMVGQLSFIDSQDGRIKPCIKVSTDTTSFLFKAWESPSQRTHVLPWSQTRDLYMGYWQAFSVCTIRADFSVDGLTSFTLGSQFYL